MAPIGFPEGDEPHGRRPTIVIHAEGLMGDVISTVPYVILTIAVFSIIVALRGNAAPWWAYSFVLPIIGLGVVKHLERKP
ncbi:MAG: hypothetical protein HYT21_00085 [Candidatus Nealsonbacteria bacterium]|nr:hypothetical protein [Candidatus Nealsonbacteria bacterium]